MKQRAIKLARVVWIVAVWKLQLWRIRPMRVYNNGIEVWIQRPAPPDDRLSDQEVSAPLAVLDELEDTDPLVTVLSSQQRLTVAVLASHLSESVGAMGSAMTLEHARLMVDQVVKQTRAVRDYVAKL